MIKHMAGFLAYLCVCVCKLHAKHQHLGQYDNKDIMIKQMAGFLCLCKQNVCVCSLRTKHQHLGQYDSEAIVITDG